MDGIKSASIEQLIGAIRAAAFDPTGPNVIVGIPRETLEQAEDGPMPMRIIRASPI